MYKIVTLQINDFKTFKKSKETNWIDWFDSFKYFWLYIERKFHLFCEDKVKESKFAKIFQISTNFCEAILSYFSSFPAIRYKPRE